MIPKKFSAIALSRQLPLRGHALYDSVFFKAFAIAIMLIYATDYIQPFFKVVVSIHNAPQKFCV